MKTFFWCVLGLLFLFAIPKKSESRSYGLGAFVQHGYLDVAEHDEKFGAGGGFSLTIGKMESHFGFQYHKGRTWIASADAGIWHYLEKETGFYAGARGGFVVHHDQEWYKKGEIYVPKHYQRKTRLRPHAVLSLGKSFMLEDYTICHDVQMDIVAFPSVYTKWYPGWGIMLKYGYRWFR